MDPAKQLRSGAAAAIYSNLIPEWVRQRARDFFAWSVDLEGTTPLAAGTTATRTFLVDADADALLVSLTGDWSDAGAFTKTPVTPPFKVSLSDSGSGRLLQNVAFMWGAMVGTGQLPGYLPYPKLIPRSSNVTVNVQNLDGANAYDLHLTFAGFKIFPFAEG